MKKSHKGFTLIEILVVISIIGLLSSIILISVNEARLKSHDALRVSQIRQIAHAVELYYADHLTYPVMLCDSRPLGGNTCWLPGGAFYNLLVPQYISSLPLDPTNYKSEGYMCSNCGEYLYQGNANRYFVSTYLATNHPQKTGVMWNNYAEVPGVTPPPFFHAGSYLWGPFFAVYANCTMTAQDDCE